MSRSGPRRKSSAVAAPARASEAQLALWPHLRGSSLITSIESSDAPSSPEKSRPRKQHSARPEIELWPVRVSDIPPADLYALWKIVERQQWFLDDTLRDPYTLGSVLVAANSRVFFLGPRVGKPEGLIYAYSITPGVSGITAAIVWGRNAVGQLALIRTAMLAVAKESRLHKFYAQIAVPNSRGHFLARKLGFQKEGVLREALSYNGQWTDTTLYGILCEEISK